MKIKQARFTTNLEKFDSVQDELLFGIVNTPDSTEVASLPSELESFENETRCLYIDSCIASSVAMDVVRFINFYNKIDENIDPNNRMPIRLFINSEGGDIHSGFSIIDAISCSLTPIYTINCGNCYSMALPIFSSGHKRFSFENSRFLIHDGINQVSGSDAKFEDEYLFIKKMRKRFSDIITSTSNITSDTLNKKRRIEWFFFAKKAKKMGLVDYIIGSDSIFDDIMEDGSV